MTTRRQLDEWFSNEKELDRLKKALPNEVRLEPWVESAKDYFWNASKLHSCEVGSLIGVIRKAASLGLDFNPGFSQLYVEVRSEGNGPHRVDLARLGIQYRGLVMLAYRSDKTLREVKAEVVRENDTFKWTFGSKPSLVHFWDPAKSRGKPIAVYTGLRYKDGYYSFNIFSYEELLKTRETVLKRQGCTFKDGKWFKYGKPVDPDAHDAPNWIGHEEAMVLKTAIRRSSKLWRLGGDFERGALLAQDEDTDLPFHEPVDEPATVPTVPTVMPVAQQATQAPPEPTQAMPAPPEPTQAMPAPPEPPQAMQTPPEPPQAMQTPPEPPQAMPVASKPKAAKRKRSNGNGNGAAKKIATTTSAAERMRKLKEAARRQNEEARANGYHADIGEQAD